jgi:RNA polymerase sigma factor (sigma-70 family)
VALIQNLPWHYAPPGNILRAMTRPDIGENNPQEAQRRWFTTTHWSVVLTAREGDAPDAVVALEKLCRTYWPPLYAYIRREGYDATDAEDLTQQFFLRLFERELLQHLRHQRGKFRSFLLTLLKHFLLDERGKSASQKRGGGKAFLSLDETDEHGRYLREPVDHLSPDQVFERRWAQRVFQVALNRLRDEYHGSGRGEFFDLMKDFQPREPGAPSYAEIGERFGMTEAAVKSAVQRLRERQRDILRAEIAHTVTKPEEINQEIRYLLAVLAHPRE